MRELENEVQRLVIQAEGETFITPELLSQRVRKNDGKALETPAQQGDAAAEDEDAQRHPPSN